MQPEQKEMWDPGGDHNTPKPNAHVCSLLVASMADSDEDNAEGSESRTELDTHANMPVVGRNALVVAETGKLVDVNPFTPEYPAMSVKVVDAAAKHECPHTGVDYLPLIRNALYVPSMRNNLVPPFAMREAGITVNDAPKIHADDPTTDDHAIMFKENNFRIPLGLWGVFSHFPTSKPSNDEHDSIDDVCMLTPTFWNPHSNACARNEENMVDWEGDVVQAKDHARILAEDPPEDVAMAAALQVGSVESQMIDNVIREHETKSEENLNMPREADQVASVLTEVSPLPDQANLCSRLETRAEIGKFSSSISATVADQNLPHLTQ